jgi:tetratricopeptide (TPR) repeat protein
MSEGVAAHRSVAAGRDIRDSVVVTGDGNLVRVSFGDSGIVLQPVRKHWPRPDRRPPPKPGEPPRELDLLNAESTVLPFIGRADMLAELHAWIDDPIDVSAHALIGRAGSGKTRLALALCEQLDPAPPQTGAWRCGFVSPADLARVVEATATRSFDWPAGTRLLIVLDYAAQSQKPLGEWLDRLAYTTLPGVRLRFLLLEREAPEQFGWWHDLTSAATRRDLFHRLRPTVLPDLADLEERRRLMQAARRAASRLRPDVAATAPLPDAGAQPGFDRRLNEPAFGNPLNLVMAGVIALEQGADAALGLSRLDAARKLGARELKRLLTLATARGIDEEAARHAVAFNELAGGLPCAGLPQTLAAELTEAALDAPGASKLASLLERELPPAATPEAAAGESRVGTIQPDLIGEAATIKAFDDAEWRKAAALGAVRRAYALDPQRAAPALVRLAQDYGYAAEDPSAPEPERSTARRVAAWLTDLTASIGDPEDLVWIAHALPQQTLILRDLALAVSTTIADGRARRANESGEMSDVAAAASAFNDLANRLSDLGRREEALAAAEQAVDLYRALAASRPDAFTPDLATSLNNLAAALSDLGRREEALAAAEQAVALRRALAASRPDAFTPDLATSLNNLATMLGDLGRREDALAAADQAVALYRTLAASRPDAFTPDLATSLNNLAAMLSDLGRREDALAAAEEAVALYSALAASRPDAFKPYLAGSLNNLAKMLIDLGRREDALAAAEQAVALRRALAASRPDVFRPYLAGSLSNLANMLSDRGQREAALDAAQEAVDLYRALAASHPDAFTPDLARSLWVLGDLQAEASDAASALATLREATKLMLPYFVAHPASFAGLTAGLCQSYIRLGEDAKIEPDMNLLAPIIAAMQTLSAGGSGHQEDDLLPVKRS